MANIREAFEYAAKNPNSDFANNLRSLAESGALNVEAKKFGLDLSHFQKPKPAPVEEKGIIQDVAQTIASPFLKGASTLRAANDNALSAVQQIAGTVLKDEALKQKGKQTAQEASKKAKEGYDYGYFGKAQPVGANAIENSQPGQLDMGAVASDIVSTGAQVASNFIPVAKGKLATKVLAGAGSGYVSDVAQNLQDENIKGIENLTPGAGTIVGASLPVVGSVVGKTAKAVKNQVVNKASKVATKELNEVLDIIKPTLSKTDEALAAAQGRKSTKGLLKKVVIEPTQKELEIANAAKGIVSKKSNAFDNIKSLQKEIDSSTKLVRKSLEKSKAIWNINELKGQLNTINLDDPQFISVKSDQVLERKFNNFKNAIIKLAENTDKKAVGLLDLRQEFDAITKKAFPKLYEKDSEILPVVRAFREALNTYTESKLPQGAVANGSKLSKELRKQHLLIAAIDNIAEKSPKEGSNAIKEYFKKHPTAKKAAATAATLGAGYVGGTAANSFLGD